MSKIVRSSKYRHVHGEAYKPDKSFLGVKAQCTGESQYIKVNQKFVAFPGWGGGGPLIVLPRNKPQRLGVNLLKVNVHKDKVYDFAFSPFMDNLIASSAEDGSVKISVIPENGLEKDVTEAQMDLSGHSKKTSFTTFNPVANNILATGAYDPAVKTWDIEKGQCITTYDDFSDLILSLEWNHNGSVLGTTCKDKKNRIFDPRQAAAACTFSGFTMGKGSRCIFADNCGLFLSVGFSEFGRTIQIHDMKKPGEAMGNVEIDQGSSLVMLHYDIDTSMLYLAGKGDPTIRYFEIVKEAPYAHFLSQFSSNESQKGVGFLPKRFVEVETCEVALCYRLLNESVVPVSFQVPRKSDLFQADIFPDTYAGRPALTAAEWAGGENQEPPTVSMKNAAERFGASAAAGNKGVNFAKAAKSPAELQKELDAANAKIKALEEELAKLKGQ